MTKVKSISKLILPLVSTAIVGNILDSGSTLAITFKETTKARLEFFDTQKNQIGNGFFEYGSNPVEGTFVEFTHSTGLDFRFVTDPSQLPNDTAIIDSISISGDEDYRLVTNIEAQIKSVELNPIFNDVLTPGDSFGNVLLFRPTETEFFVPGLDGISSISTGDARDPMLSQRDGWLLTDGSTGIDATQQVVLSDNGTLGGFLLDAPSDPSVDGTWTAQAIPEPLTIFGTATALGFGVFFKKKKLLSKTQ